MAHFAEIDQNNRVLRVVVTSNNDVNEGYDWLLDNLGGTWVQTSYNSNFRKQFAGIGFTYNEEADVFIQPQPFPSWVLDEAFDWQPPVPSPGKDYMWDEDSLSWELANFSESEA
jgi:hypothetical protein